MEEQMVGDPLDYSKIRKLLLAAFTPEDLRRFCYDRSSFRAVVDRFGAGYGHDDMVDEVITYCDTRLLFDELLAAVQKENPRQYALFKSDRAVPSPSLPPTPDHPIHNIDESFTGTVNTVIRTAEQVHETGKQGAYATSQHLALPGAAPLGDELLSDVQFGSDRQQYTLSGQSATVLHPCG
jgi:hypothetical protein